MIKDVDDWLPVTGSRNAKWWYSTFHNVTAMVGAGVLGLPSAMVYVGWVAGTVVLVLSWVITLFTLWQMVEMHKMVPGKRLDRYHELGQEAFGERWGLYIVVPQQLIVDIGVDIVYMVTGGQSLFKFYRLIRCPGLPASNLSTSCRHIGQTPFIVIFASQHFLLARKYNSIAGISLAAAVMSLSYSTIAWADTVEEGRKDYHLPDTTLPNLVFGAMSSFGTAGHNVVLEMSSRFTIVPWKTEWVNIDPHISPDLDFLSLFESSQWRVWVQKSSHLTTTSTYLFLKIQHTKMPFFKYRLLVQFIVILIVVPLLINMLSADIYNGLRHCPVALRYVMVISALIVCGAVNTFYIEAHHSEEKGSSLPRFTTDAQVTKATGSLVSDPSQVIDHRLDAPGRQMESLAWDPESLADAPAGPDFPGSKRDFLVVQDTVYDWCRQEWEGRHEVHPQTRMKIHTDKFALKGKGRHEVLDPQARMKIHTDKSVLDVGKKFPLKATGSLVCDLSQVIDHRVNSSGKQVESLAWDAAGGPYFPGSEHDFVVVQDTLYDWCRQEWKGGREVEDPQATLTIHTNESVLVVGEEFQSDIIIRGSKVLLRRLEIGSQTTKSELDKLSSNFYAAMRRARAIDEDCTLQLGSFALLKYTDAGLRSWRLQKQWTPTICCVVRYWDLLDLLPGQTTKWSIRGFNLQNAVLKVSTTEECEKLKILHQYQESGEYVLICEEPRLHRHAPPTGGEAVYIYAVKSLEIEKGVTVDVQSKPKNVPRANWISVVECLRHSPWNTVITVPCMQACIMIMIAVLIMSITHHHDLQQTGNIGISLEENSLLSIFWHELPFFFLVLIGAHLIFKAASTLRRLIEGRPLVDNVPGRGITRTSEDLSGDLNASSLVHSENELGLKGDGVDNNDVVNIEGQVEEDECGDLSGDINPSSPAHSENEEKFEEEEDSDGGSGVLDGESTSTFSDSIDNVSFKTTLPAVADNKSIGKTENLEVDVGPAAVAADRGGELVGWNTDEPGVLRSGTQKVTCKPYAIVVDGLQGEVRMEVIFILERTRREGHTEVLLKVNQVDFGIKTCCKRDSERSSDEFFIKKVMIEVRPDAWAQECQRVVIDGRHVTPEEYQLQHSSTYGFQLPVVYPMRASVTYQAGNTLSNRAASFAWTPTSRDSRNAVTWQWELSRFVGGTDIHFNKWGSRPQLGFPPASVQIHPGVNASWHIPDTAELQVAQPVWDITIIVGTAVFKRNTCLPGHFVGEGPTLTYDERLALV